MAENMRLLCYRVVYQTRAGNTFTHIVHRVDDALRIRRTARKDKHKIIACDKMLYQADYTIQTLPI